MTNKITKVYKNGVAYDIYASGGAAGTGDVTGPSSSTDADIALFSGTTGKIIKDSGKKLSDYQTALSTQTAYTSKGTATKVPTITTNTLGQVTGITETSITFPVTSVNGSTGAVTGLQTTSNLKTSLSDNSDSYYPSQKAVKTAVDGKQATLVSGTNIKTVNGSSLLGSGDLTVSGLPSGGTEGQFLMIKNGTPTRSTIEGPEITDVLYPAGQTGAMYTEGGVCITPKSTCSLTKVGLISSVSGGTLNIAKGTSLASYDSSTLATYTGYNGIELGLPTPYKMIGGENYIIRTTGSSRYWLNQGGHLPKEGTNVKFNHGAYSNGETSTNRVFLSSLTTKALPLG